MLLAPLEHRPMLRTRIATACFTAFLLFIFHSAHAQSTHSSERGFMRHFTFRGSGGLTSPVGGTGGIMKEGWNVGGGAGVRVGRRIAILVETQFDRTGIGDSLLRYNLFSRGTYDMGTLALNGSYSYWQHGKFGGYIIGGGGYSRTVTTYTSPGTGRHCYLLCTCYNNCSGVSGRALFRYSSNQPMADAGFGFTMRIWPNRRYKLYTEARYENLFENSDLAPYKNVELVPLSAGIQW